MRPVALLLPACLLLVQGGERVRELPVAQANDNREPAGEFRDGILRITLEARIAIWHPDGDSLPGIPVEVFGEPGRAPQAPGPLIRVPAGTSIQVTVRNILPRDTITFALPSPGARDGRAVADSVAIPPGESRELTTKLAPGTYLYRGWTNSGFGPAMGVAGVLTGALVVDSTATPSRDRILLVSVTADSLDAAGFSEPTRSIFAINGRTWPHTERLDAAVGDTVRWRLVNTSKESHPMHLHGFYFRVDAFGGPKVAENGQGPLPRLVVTERMSGFSTMEMVWVPERAGNWLFHCHFQIHILPHGPLDAGGPSSGKPRIGHPDPTRVHAAKNHATTGMSGLVLGVTVRPGPGPATEQGPAPRRFRMIAVQDSGYPATAPFMRFTLDGTTGAHLDGPGSPVLTLTRGEPVAITVVNRLREPTAVHWHGIELDSYFDGVAGFSGAGPRTAPIIAPGDSFVARFTPPRAGTFIYHSHVNEPVQHRAGLVAPLIVREPGGSSTDDLTFMIKSARDPGSPVALEVNGTSDPDTLVLHAGRAYRLRFISMTVGNPAATIWMTARPDSAMLRPVNDSLILRWHPLAKDGAELPGADRIPRLARQIISMGETYDFQFVPESRGDLRIEIRGDIGRQRLLARVPVRVE